jgi:hypothetical protein
MSTCIAEYKTTYAAIEVEPSRSPRPRSHETSRRMTASNPSGTTAATKSVIRTWATGSALSWLENPQITTAPAVQLMAVSSTSRAAT